MLTSSSSAAGSSWNMLSVTTTKTWFAMMQARTDSLAKFATSSVHLLDGMARTDGTTRDGAHRGGQNPDSP